MAIFTFTNGYLSVNGVDLSNHVRSITVSDNRDQQEVTAMGATAKGYIKGLGDATVEAEMYMDYAAGSVYATLQPLINSTTSVTVEARAVNAARSATNPGFVLTSAQLFSFNPVAGAVGEVAMMTATFQNSSSSGGLTYPTA